MQNDNQEYQCEMIIAEGRDDFKDADFTKVFKLMSRKVVLDLGNGKINGAADTLWWIMDQMPMNNNYVGAKPQNIARDIGKSVVQVRRHLKHLLNLGYIAKTDIIHNYRVNPAMMFRGNAKRGYQIGRMGGGYILK